jgi:long-chain acyl-CoA synthetase
VIVSLNYRLAPEELRFIAQDAGLAMLITDQDVDLGCERVEWEALLSGPPRPPRDLPEDTLAAISYTGGTTGLPKGVMLSHRNLLANAQHNLAATGHRSDQRWLHVCPMFHVAGIANLIACTWVGAEQVLLPRFDAAAVLETIERERITHTVLVPTMLAMLLNAPGAADADLSSLRHVQYAASPISAELQRRVLERLPDCDVAQFYGMTEAAPTVTHLSGEEHRRGGRPLASVGRPVPGVEVDVRDGELWIRGPNVMLGYWNRPEETAAALVDGWYRSGDLVAEDEDGYLYVVDRAKDMIVSGGENVYSLEVEAALLRHPAVDEAAAFGVPDDRWGEAVHAVVVPRAEVTEAALLEHCRGVIAGFKVPREIELRSEPLPKSGPGKVLKSRLREPFWAGRERRVN